MSTATVDSTDSGAGFLSIVSGLMMGAVGVLSGVFMCAKVVFTFVSVVVSTAVDVVRVFAVSLPVLFTGIAAFGAILLVPSTSIDFLPAIGQQYLPHLAGISAALTTLWISRGGFRSSTVIMITGEENAS